MCKFLMIFIFIVTTPLFAQNMENTQDAVQETTQKEATVQGDDLNRERRRNRGIERMVERIELNPTQHECVMLANCNSLEEDSENRRGMSNAKRDCLMKAYRDCKVDDPSIRRMEREVRRRRD